MNIAEIGNALGPWLQVLSMLGAVVQCVGTIVLWMLVRKFMTREECEDCRKVCRRQVDERLGKQEANSGELHQAVSQAAPKEDLAKVDKADEALRGEIKALAATIQAQGEAMRAMGRQLNLLMEHHLGRRP